MKPQQENTVLDENLEEISDELDSIKKNFSLAIDELKGLKKKRKDLYEDCKCLVGDTYELLKNAN